MHQKVGCASIHKFLFLFGTLESTFGERKSQCQDYHL